MHDSVSGSYASGRGAPVRTVSAWSQLPFQKGVHICLHDLRGPHEANDEPLYKTWSSSIGNHSLTLIGRRTRLKPRMSYVVRVIDHR